MKEEIYRKKSLERLSAPEDLNDYIRVSGAGVWILLVAVAVLLIGGLTWAVLGTYEDTMDTRLYVDQGETVCYVTSGELSRVRTGMAVKTDSAEGVITAIGRRESRGVALSVDLTPVPEDGEYDGRIVIRQFRPISFLTD